LKRMKWSVIGAEGWILVTYNRILPVKLQRLVVDT